MLYFEPYVRYILTVFAHWLYLIDAVFALYKYRNSTVIHLFCQLEDWAYIFNEEWAAQQPIWHKIIELQSKRELRATAEAPQIHVSPEGFSVLRRCKICTELSRYSLNVKERPSSHDFSLARPEVKTLENFQSSQWENRRKSFARFTASKWGVENVINKWNKIK